MKTIKNEIKVEDKEYIDISIKEVVVYNLKNSILYSGYPMNPSDIYIKKFNEANIPAERLDKAISLGNAKGGSGHDCFLKGITVSFSIKFPQYIWQQAKRYNWFDFISGKSTMHCILKYDIEKNCNRFVSSNTIELLQEAIEVYNNCSSEKELSAFYLQAYMKHSVEIGSKEELFAYIISNIPSGFMLEAGMTTNYLQLKTMYAQRKNHKMLEWREFCRFIESLPMSELIVNKRK